MKYIQFRQKDISLLEQPVVLLSGKEKYFRDDIQKSIRDTPNTRIQKTPEGDLRSSRILEQFFSRSLDQKKLVFWIENASSTVLDDHSELIEKCLRNPDTDNTLVFEAPGADADDIDTEQQRKHLLHIDCSPPSSRQIRRWIQSFFRKQELDIPGSAVEELIERTGEELHKLRGEMEKLALYAMDQDEVTREDVRQCVIRRKRIDFFDFLDKWLEGENEPVLREVRESLRQGESEGKISGGLLWALRRLRFILEMKNQDASVSEIQEHVNMPPRILKRDLRRFRNVDPDQLRNATESFLTKDLLVRSGKMNPEDAIEFLVLRGFSEFNDL